MTVRKFAEVVEVGKATAFTQDDPTSRQRRVFIRIGDQLVQFGDVGFKQIPEGSLLPLNQKPSFEWDALFDENVTDIFGAMAEIMGSDGVALEEAQLAIGKLKQEKSDLEERMAFMEDEIVELRDKAARLEGQRDAERSLYENLGLHSMISLINARIRGE